MVSRRRDARHIPILTIVPGNGTGIQLIKGHNRQQPYVVWNKGEIEQFCSDSNEAYFVLQEILDGWRTGLDWDEPEEDDDGEDF